MQKTEFFLASSLEKVFPGTRPAPYESAQLSAWRGTRAAVQLVSLGGDAQGGGLTHRFSVSVTGAPGEAELFSVELVPSDFPCWESSRGDENYLTREPGLFPDLLRPLADGSLVPVPRQYRAVWISFFIPETAAPGAYGVSIAVTPQAEAAAAGEEGAVLSLRLRVGSVPLVPQRLLHTEWFHADCLASYYGVRPLSEEHWRILEKFIREAGRRHGINLLLTPVFTPPLDTAVGAERPTVQLAGVRVRGGAYSFDFSALRRWAGICRAAGIENLEIAHLFTQWGAKATPKIVADADGVVKRIFGWDVPADSPAYRRFLQAFLPALLKELDALGYDREHVFFHISDEPGEADLESYLAAKRQAADLLEGCHIIDAMSSLEFYRRGVVTEPVCASDHIRPFLDAKVDPLWVYYCCAQGNAVPNRFFAMPSARNRVMGVLLYLHRLRGFLQWGYNFYYSSYSRSLIDPFAVTHSGYAFPSGDAFLVYPGPGGEPLTSLRAEVQSEGLTDLRALQTLEERAGREEVRRLVLGIAGMEELTFTSYPTSSDFLLALREAVLDALERLA